MLNSTISTSAWLIVIASQGHNVLAPLLSSQGHRVLAPLVSRKSCPPDTAYL